jgi:hypothetical protein
LFYEKKNQYHNFIVCLCFCIFSKHNYRLIPHLGSQQVRLEGFDGFTTYSIASARISEGGDFELNYSGSDYGMGYLAAEDNKPFFVVLSGEAIHLKGEAFALPETIEILKGEENQLFGKYASEHPRREQALSAWVYLEKIYTMDSLFALQEIPKQSIAKEKQRIKAEDSMFLAGLDPQSFISWYLPARKLISSVPAVAQYRTEEIPASNSSL